MRQIFAAADGVVAPIARAHWADTPPAADKPRPWPMSPQDLSDEALTAVHDGATPIYFRDRPQYYTTRTLLAESLAGQERRCRRFGISSARRSGRSTGRGALID